MKINWNIERFKIILSINDINTINYQMKDIIPTEFNNCKSWRFSKEKNNILGNFTAIWEKKKIKNLEKLKAKVDQKMLKY